LARLEDIKLGAKAQGIIPNILAEIMSVEWIGSQREKERKRVCF